MKFIARLALLCSMAMTQFAWADAGPYYVSYPGFCDVKKVYINARNDVYGTETSCSKFVGNALIGSFMADGKVVVAYNVNTVPCLFTHSPNGSLTIACSAGGPVAYENNNGYVVRQSFSEKSVESAKVLYTFSTEMPDIEKIKNLPALGIQ